MPTPFLSTLVAITLLVMAGGSPAAVARTSTDGTEADRQLADRPGPARMAGSIEGRILYDLAPARRVAARYPGAGAANRDLHPVPVVVYLEGDLPAATGPAAPVRIEQREGRFSPGALAVSSGTRIDFPNEDPFYHNVFSYSGPRFDLGRYPVGESRSVVFDEPGVVGVFCEIHPFMRAVVVVTDHGFHAVLGEDGTFRLDGVPPGAYALHAFHPDLGESVTAVFVRDGIVTRIEARLGS